METECAKMRGREPVLIPSQGRLQGMGRPNDLEKPYRRAYWEMKNNTFTAAHLRQSHLQRG